MLAGKDARTLARELLAMTQEEFSVAFKNSPMKRAKLRGLKRNAAVVLGNVGTVEDVPVLQQALNDEEPLVREHARVQQADPYAAPLIRGCRPGREESVGLLGRPDTAPAHMR